MAKVVRPIRFDNVRREKHNARRRAKDRIRREKDRERYRLFNNFFWFNIEPPVMWDSTPWSGNGANDNELQADRKRH